MRNVTVRATWESVHTIEVPDDTEKIRKDDHDTLLQVSGDDIHSNIAELVDWEVQDDGPRAS